MNWTNDTCLSYQGDANEYNINTHGSKPITILVPDLLPLPAASNPVKIFFYNGSGVNIPASQVTTTCATGSVGADGNDYGTTVSLSVGGSCVLTTRASLGVFDYQYSGTLSRTAGAYALAAGGTVSRLTVLPTATFNPAGGAIGVAADSSITITFNHAIRLLNNFAVTDANVDDLITLKDTNDSGSDIGFDATINAGKTVITITPTSVFSGGQVVYAAIGATVENALNTAITATNATFTAAAVDSTEPTVTFDPLDSATAVAVGSSITITFDEAIRNIDDSEVTDANVDALITLKDTNGSGSNIGFDATINAGKTVITINPTSDFSSEQVVYAAIGASVEDASDNAITGSSATFTAADSIAPTATFDPVDSATAVTVGPTSSSPSPRRSGISTIRK